MGKDLCKCGCFKDIEITLDYRGEAVNVFTGVLIRETEGDFLTEQEVGDMGTEGEAGMV